MSLQGMLVGLRSLGSCSAICEKLPSAVRNNGRKAFALLMVLVMGVRLPVFAANIKYDDGFIYPEAGLTIDGISVSSSTGESIDYDILNGYFPATFTSDNFSGDPDTRRLYIQGSVLPNFDGDTSYSVSTQNQFYIEVLQPVVAPVSFTSEPYDSKTPYVFCRVGLGLFDTSTFLGSAAIASDVSFIVDDSVYPLNVNSDNQNYFDVRTGSYEINRYWGYRFYFNPLSSLVSSTSEMCFKLLFMETFLSYTFSDPNYLAGINNNVIVNTGILQDINGTLKEIQTSTTQIQGDVSDIKDTVSDTHEQLENPDSNIWQAAGSAISDAVTGLFVPEQAELDAKMKEVEEIVIDKLGDTYEVIERVDQYEDQLVSGFTGGGRQYNFHFPGISVPLPDGTVTILPEQDVSIENNAFIVFRDLLGTGVALLCGFAAVHIAHDFIICILSGVSYWGFLRGRHDK